MSLNPSERTISQGVCCGCNLLCDDVTWIANSEGPEPLSGYCERGAAWFQSLLSSEAVAYVDGRTLTLTSALEETRHRIGQSRHLQIVGLDQLDQRSVRAAAQLAMACRGSIDINFQPVSSFEFALQKVGRVTATLGEIRQRSDLVVLWFCDPLASHPRLLERINAADKKVIWVSDQSPNNPMGLDFNGVFEFSRNEADECLEWLRLVVNAKSPSEFAEIPTPFAELIDLLVGARYVSLFADPNGSSDPYSAVSLHEAIRCLNDRGRAVLFPLRHDHQGLGAENVLLSVFGLARAINLNTGYPRFHWNEFSAIEQIRRGETDVVLWICDAVTQEQVDWQSRFPNVEWIIWNTNHQTQPPNSGVFIPISILGLSESCDLTRLDDLLLPISCNRKTAAPSPLELLGTLIASSTHSRSL